MLRTPGRAHPAPGWLPRKACIPSPEADDRKWSGGARKRGHAGQSWPTPGWLRRPRPHPQTIVVHSEQRPICRQGLGKAVWMVISALKSQEVWEWLPATPPTNCVCVTLGKPLNLSTLKKGLIAVPWAFGGNSMTFCKTRFNIKVSADVCWSWSSNTLTTECEKWTHWKRPWCWERLRAKGGGGRGWDS